MTSYQFNALMEALRSIDDKLTDLIAQDRQELLKRIEGELPHTRVHVPELYKPSKFGYSQEHCGGFNTAIKEVQAIINTIKGDN